MGRRKPVKLTRELYVPEPDQAVVFIGTDTTAKLTISWPLYLRLGRPANLTVDTAGDE